jgi:hypothetical protein
LHRIKPARIREQPLCFLKGKVVRGVCEKPLIRVQQIVAGEAGFVTANESRT